MPDFYLYTLNCYMYRTILTWCSWQFWPLKLPTIFDTTMTSLFGQVKICMFMALSLSKKLWIFRVLTQKSGLVFKKVENQRYERFRFQTVQFKVKWIFNISFSYFCSLVFYTGFFFNEYFWRSLYRKYWQKTLKFIQNAIEFLYFIFFILFWKKEGGAIMNYTENFLGFLSIITNFAYHHYH